MFGYKYDISIVMGYYNRKLQTINTLNYFQQRYGIHDYEVIIVDDNSVVDQQLGGRWPSRLRWEVWRRMC